MGLARGPDCKPPGGGERQRERLLTARVRQMEEALACLARLDAAQGSNVAEVRVPTVSHGGLVICIY